jgi:hypothetical protein
VLTPVSRGAHAVEYYAESGRAFPGSIEMFWSVNPVVSDAATVKLLEDGIEPQRVLVKKCQWRGRFPVDRAGRRTNINNT